MRRLARMFLICGVLVMGVGPSDGQPVPGQPIHYLEQGWTDADRTAFYHRDQGINLFPYPWFLALANLVVPMLPDNRPPMMKDTLPLYGFIPDAVDPVANPHGLPVGFTRASRAGLGDMLGLNCAACHTGQFYVTTAGTRQPYRVDGGPSMQKNLDFIQTLFGSLLMTVTKDEISLPKCEQIEPKEKKHFSDFAERLGLKSPDEPGIDANEKQAREMKRMQLKAAACDFLKKRALRGLLAARDQGIQTPTPRNWGAGRLDAFGRGMDLVFMGLDRGNVRDANGPVNPPALWDTWKYDWLQWSGSAQNYLARSIAETIAAGAVLKFQPTPDPPVIADVNLTDLNFLDDKIKNLKPPVWPAAFGPINPDLKKKGETLYGQWCAACHVPQVVTRPVTPGQTEALAVIPLEQIGTDPSQSFNFYERTVKTGPLQGRVDKQGPLGEQESAIRMVEFVTTEIMKQKGQPASHNSWRTLLGYLARPNRGVWATAPFLHNGSVRTLDQLLLPVEERDQFFCIEDAEFDPVNVGFKSLDSPKEKCTITARRAFNTALPGNADRGHEYRHGVFTVAECAAFRDPNVLPANKPKPRDGALGCKLDPDERKALIEYLKTL